jgi:alkanesulfonate monooxygenase SsuD/methylene tetrahydromethanopterin reductase-like flavin-dependent oxidoreductase (luciferase family)
LFQHMDRRADHRELVPSSTVKRFALAGTPAAVARQIHTLRDAGVERVALVVLGPAWEHTLDLFGRAVLPRLAPRTACGQP